MARLTLRFGLITIALLAGVLYFAQPAAAQDEAPAVIESEAEVTLTPETLPVEATAEVEQPAQDGIVETIEPVLPAPAATDVPVVQPVNPASVSLIADVARLPTGGVVTLSLNAQELSGAETISLICGADAAMVKGIQTVRGEWLADTTVEVLDGGFAQNGQWMVILSQTGSLNGSGTLLHLQYQLVSAGYTQITCQTQLLDSNGQALPLHVPDTGVMVEAYAEAAPVAAPIVPIPNSEPVVVEVETTPAPVIAAAATTAQVSGQVSVSAPISAMLVSETSQQSLVFDADGRFHFVAAYGQYQLLVSASGYVPQVLDLTIETPEFVVDTITLNPVVTPTTEPTLPAILPPAELIVSNYGIAVPPADPQADVNGDLLVDIYDLVIVSAAKE